MAMQFTTIVLTYALLASSVLLPGYLVHHMLEGKGARPIFRIITPLATQFILLVLISYLVFAPGSVGPDVAYALRKAATGNWPDLHPHGLSIIFKTLNTPTYGPSTALVFCLCALAAGTIMILSSGLRETNPVILTLIPAVFFFPATFTLFGMLWKDIFHLGFYLLAWGFCLVSRGNPIRFLQILCTIGCLVCVSFGVFLRLNAPAAALPIVVLLFAPKGEPRFKKFCSRGILVSASWILASFALHRAHHSLSDLHHLSFATHQRHELAYLSARTSTDVFSGTPWADGVDWPWIKETYLRKLEYPFAQSQIVLLVRRLKHPWLVDNDEQSRWATEITQLWKSAILRNPATYLHFKLMNMLGLLGVFHGPQGQAYFSAKFPGHENYPFRLEQSALSEWFFSVFILPTQRSIFCWPLGYIPFVIFPLFLSIRWRRDPDSGACFGILASGLLMQLSFGLLVQNYEYRWSHYFIFCTVLSVAVGIKILARHRSLSSSRVHKIETQPLPLSPEAG